jgi:Protein of unknown function (DUF1091)
MVFKKFSFNINPNFGKAISSIETLPNGIPTINININLTKPLNGKVQVSYALMRIKIYRFQYLSFRKKQSTLQIKRLKGKTNTQVIRVPTFNYCDMMRGHFMPVQLIQIIIDQVSKFGRLLVPCPVQPGHYYVKNAYIDDTRFPMYRLMKETSVLILVGTFSQEVSRKMVRVYDMEAYFSCNRSNWP